MRRICEPAKCPIIITFRGTIRDSIIATTANQLVSTRRGPILPRSFSKASITDAGYLAAGPPVIAFPRTITFARNTVWLLRFEPWDEPKDRAVAVNERTARLETMPALIRHRLDTA